MLCCDRQNYVHSFICCFFTTIKRKQVNLNNQFVYIRLATLQIVAVFSVFFFSAKLTHALLNLRTEHCNLNPLSPQH